MDHQQTSAPRVCVLTQTASDVRPYYRQFFASFDLFFVTFKRENPEAVDFLPGSTWSDGRNRLWEHVKGRYDYYFFVDDDLEFFRLPTGLPSAIEYLLQKKVQLQEKLHLRGTVTRILEMFAYKEAVPAQFRELFLDKLKTYSPMIASLARLGEPGDVGALDVYSLRRNRQVRPLGWFDAQATLLSDVAAHLLLPYDTDFSGWWSSQIPIYLLGHLAFRERAISILNLATDNAKHTIYRPGYDGVRDCLDMSAWLSKGILDPNCDPIDLPDGSFIDQRFCSEFVKMKVTPGEPQDRTLEEALTTLGKSFDLHHPYIYERHKDLVDALDAKRSGKVAETAHG